MVPDVSVDLVDPSSDLHETILGGLREFNRRLLESHPPGQDLAIAIRESEGEAVGGLWGRTAGGWLAIELIFVPDHLRGKGLASHLIDLAENEARRRGCHSAWLDTLNPKALSLYESLGYARFGELKDYPVGSNRYFLEKKLNA